MTRSLRDDDGANAVEFALVLPILVVLVFGIFTVGMAFNLKLVSNHAARDAARFGATLPFEDDGSGGMAREWFVDVRDRAVEAGEGHYGDTTGASFAGADGAAICVGYNDGTDWRSYTWTGSTETDATSACYAEDLTGERVQVHLQHDAAYNIVFLPPSTLTLTSEAVARFEDRPAPTSTPSPTPTSP